MLIHSQYLEKGNGTMKKCLIVVDYQNDFVSGSLGFPEAQALEAGIVEKIQAYRSQGDEVLFTFDTHTKDYLLTREGRYLPVPHCIGGTPGHKLYGKVGENCDKEDWCFIKYTFGSDALFDFLKEHRYSCIELVGVVTNICVISNAILAKTAQPETDIVVDAACTASNDPALHQKAMDVMESLQIQIRNRKDS
jgi:nicotinamidase-related amidase